MMNTAQTQPHLPVMLGEVLDMLSPQDGETYVDGTFGAGGYSRAILNHADCSLISIDRDPSAAQTGRDMEGEYKGRFTFVPGCFGDMDVLLSDKKGDIDGVVLDIGVSSMQIDQDTRGFSFKKDGPLDMRMSQDGMSAADFINGADEKTIADVIFNYGEERHSRKIAKKIVEKRAEKPFERTSELAALVADCVPKNFKSKTDPATKTFQALRIHINDELGELERGLKAATHLLKPGGRLVVVTFHSLEDGIVKRFLKDNSAPLRSVNKYAKEPENKDDYTRYAYSVETKRPLDVSSQEAKDNPRARSAKLRCAIRMEGALA